MDQLASTRPPGTGPHCAAVGRPEGVDAETILDVLPELVVVLDRLGSIRYVNETGTMLLGFDRHDWIGRSALDLVHPDDLALAAESLLGTAATGPGVKVPVELRLATESGAFLPVEVVANNLTADRLDGVVLTCRDVSRRISATASVSEVERRLHEAFDGAGIGMAQLALDGRILRVNRRFSAMVGVPADQLVGRPLSELVDPAERDDHLIEISRLADGEDESFVATRCYRTGSRAVHAHVTASLVSDDRRAPLYVAAQFVDISEQVAASAALAESEARYRQIVELADEGIWTVDRHDITTFVNPRMAEMLGYDREEIIGRSPLDFTDDEGRAIAAERFAHRRRGVKESYDFRYVRRDGSGLWTRVTTSPRFDDDGGFADATALITDIGELRAATLELEHRATHDQLTGLANRSLMHELLDQSLARGARRGGRLAVLFIDLDGFKAVNDTYGHGAGDHVLAEVARRLGVAVRAGDVTARLGGDEFVVVCEDVDHADALSVAVRIVRYLSAPVTVGDQSVDVTASVGLTVGEADMSSSAELLERADAALYRAKAEGKNRVVLWSDDGFERSVSANAAITR